MTIRATQLRGKTRERLAQANGPRPKNERRRDAYVMKRRFVG